MKLIKLRLLILLPFLFWITSIDTNAANVSRDEVYAEIGKHIDTPDSFQYINLLYADIERTDAWFAWLQKLVYEGKLNNRIVNVYPDREITKIELYGLLNTTADRNINEIEYLKSGEWYATQEDIDIIKRLYGEVLSIKISEPESNIDATKLRIFNDVYNSLNANHFDSDNFSKTELIDSAIEWLARWTGDPYTSYFPPIENEDFQQELQWEFSGIWAHVDMITPWEVIIIAPLLGSPAEEAWLRAWDIIYAIDGVEISIDETLRDVTAKIKGQEWTEVILWIIRDGVKKDFPVIRGLIVVPDITGEKLNNSTYYISMRMFTWNIAEQFTAQLELLNNERWIEKIIIDLRNNPGWFLDQVVDVLWHFIPKGEPVAVIKYKNSEQSYTSFGYEIYDFTWKEIVILTNKWSASASEILAWTLKDYFPDQVTIVWDTTFWKWSVQTQRAYTDGSALKYTIANWFTWKTEIWIDGVWLSPDVQVEFDQELYNETEKDTQLIEAINL